MAARDYRIASYCSSPSWGGLEMNVLRFLRWMKQRGWSVGYYGPPGARLYAEAQQAGVRTGSVVSRLRSGDPVNAWRLAGKIRRDNVRRLIVHRSQDLFMGVIAKYLAGGSCRLVFHQHMHIGGDKKDFYHAWLYRQIDAFVTPVQWLADRVLDKTSLPGERLHIIPRGVEVERFTTRKPTKAEARERLGLPLDATVIGLVGRLDPKKGQDIVIKALAKVHTAGHRPHLLLVGDQSFGEGDQYTATVHGLVAESNLTDYVHFRPHQKDVEYAYAALDIFVLASKSECYGMVTVEALVSGLPVIGTNDGGTISLIDPGRNGLLVEPRDVDDLTGALMALLNDKQLVQRMSREAGKESAVKYSHQRQCESWEVVLDTLDN